jgi:hypothetical protein
MISQFLGYFGKAIASAALDFVGGAQAGKDDLPRQGSGGGGKEFQCSNGY